MKFVFLIILIAFIYHDSNAQTNLLSISNDLDSATENIPWINQSNTVQGDAFSGTNYSATDSIHPFGLGYKGSFPLQCRNRNLKIKFSEFIRTKIIAKEIPIVITVTIGDSTIYWNAINISQRINVSFLEFRIFIFPESLL